MSILAPSINGSLDQLFDAPLKCFKAAYSKSDHSSQLEEVQIILELQPSDPPQTMLDAIAVNLDTITILMDVDTSIQMIKTIQLDCPTLDIGELESSSLGSEPRASWSQIPVRGEAVYSPPTGNTQSIRKQDNRNEEASPDPLSFTKSTHRQEDHNIGFQDEDLYDATPPRSSKQNGDTKGIADNDDTIRVETAKPKSRAAVKLKAKPPIIQNSRGSTGHQKSTKPEVLATEKRKSPAGKEEGIEGDVSLPAKPTKPSRSQEESHPSGSAGAQKSTSMAIAGVAKNNQAGSQTKVLSQGSKPKLKSIQEVSKAKKNVFDIHEGGDITSSNTAVEKSRPLGPVRSQKPRKIEAQPTVQSTKKRYSLQGLHMPSSAPSDVDPFEIPDDPMELSKKANTKTSKPRTKVNAKTVDSTAKITKKKGLNATEPSEAKKRQSAPAVLKESNLRVRESKRAAATKAKARIHNADDSDEDFEAAIISYANLGSESNRKSKTKSAEQTQKKESQASTKAPLATGADSTQSTVNPTLKNKPAEAQIKTTTKPTEVTTNREIAVAKEVANGKQVTKSIDLHGEIVNAKENLIPKSVEAETDVNQIQQDDARELGLIQRDSAPRASDDNLPMDMLADQTHQTPAKPVIQQKVNAPTKITGNSPKKAFADKLGNLLEDLADLGDELEAEGLQKTLTSGFVDNKNKLQPKVQDRVLTTSPFPPSSNLMEQTSPELIILQPNPGDHSRQESLASDMENENAENEPPVREQPKHLSTAKNALSPGGKRSSSPGQNSQSSRMKQGQIVAPSSEFRKPNIEAIKQISKKSISPMEQSPRNHAVEDKVVQTSAYKMVAVGMGKPTSSAAEHIGGNIEQEPRNMEPKEPQKKRKSTASDSPLAKRQRKQGDQVQRAGDDTVSQAPESSCKQSTRAVRSPELPEHPRNGVKEVERKQVNGSASKDPSRKPNIIAFSNSGPLNQGKFNITKKTANKTSEVPVTSEVVEHKRKRKPEKATDEAPQSPPKKRQHSSPIQYDDNLAQSQVEEGFPMNGPFNERSPVEASGRHTRSRSNRQSSQTSRVDEKGSPVAAGDIDHMRNLKERMSQSARPESPHDHQSTNSAAESPEDNKQGFSVIFAPRVELEVKEKARAASPQEEVTSRYIAHERTAHGHYKGIQSQEVVAPETELADPFKDAPSRSTPFIERLRRSSKEIDAAEAQPQVRHLALPGSQVNGNDALPQVPRQNSARIRRSDANNRTRFNVQEDPEKTLVGSGRGHGRQISPGDMTNGSSPESRSSGQSTKEVEDQLPLGEMRWNVALRPHYVTAREAIHLIADVRLIPLPQPDILLTIP